MEIKLKKITLINFKGISKKEILFGEEETTISGANGTGKTTVFDAFTWLMFGKNSEDAKDFGIKTNDKDGNVIPKLPHEVSATLIIDGQVTELRKRFLEKWTKKRGAAEETFTGHEVECFINDVPTKVGDYQKYISSLCAEDVFKLITNPVYFTAQKWDLQRKMLFDLAGEISDKDIAAGNKDFENLLLQLTGKDLEKYRLEINAKKKLIKNSILDIPGRIDERKRSNPEEKDWASLEKELSDKKEKLAEIENGIADKSKSYEAEANKRNELLKELSDKKEKLNEAIHSIKESYMASYYANREKRQALLNDIKNLQARIVSVDETNTERTKQSSEYLAQLNNLRAEWKEINAKTISFDEKDFICPTCKRPFDVEDIEQKKAILTENFNSHKANELTTNVQNGKAIKAKNEDLLAKIEADNLLKDKLNENIESINKQLAEIPEEKQPDLKNISYVNKTTASLEKEIVNLEKQTSTEVEAVDVEELKIGKKVLEQAISELNKELDDRRQIEANNKRIQELENELRANNQQLADLERMEFTISEFSKAKVTIVENRINQKFSIVKWKLFEMQVNGAEVETCEAMVNGVPFSDLNNAMRINAGLDIINAFCKHYNVYAPIFFDNAESVNKLLSTESQMIRLVVTNDKELTIKINK